MLVGRNPGREEDRSGRPFVGRSGALLDDTLRRFGYSRDIMIVTNTLKCFTTDNRPPTAAEYAGCMARHLVGEVTAAQPRVLVLLGADAFGCLVDKTPMRQARQKFWPIASLLDTSAVAIIHPSAVLRQPSNEAQWLADWNWLVRTERWQRAYLDTVSGLAAQAG